MIRISVNRATCLGYGNCELVAGDLFQVESDGIAVARSELVEAAERESVRAAAYDCPTGSISFDDVSDT
jgi:ferredoxin